ncbi:hypothetical protein [Pontibacter liquoris]|uniref:hypothetical protein n=1 Tax=Pontibacter liquoris TaxID=2905677 RepID=UPI001FA6AD82|nr:hypothetical protein [Pontibacter liquoris]
MLTDTAYRQFERSGNWVGRHDSQFVTGGSMNMKKASYKLAAKYNHTLRCR